MRVSRCKMTFYRSLSALLVPVCWVALSVAEDANTHGSTGALRHPVTNSSKLNSTGLNSTGLNSTGLNSTGLNSTDSNGKDPLDGFGVDTSMIQRALYVLIAITMIGVLYFLIQAVQLKNPVYEKKYGLLSSYDDAVEMEAVDSEEDETVYEARSLRR